MKTLLLAVAIGAVSAAGAAEVPQPTRPTSQQTVDRLLGLLKVAPDEQTAAAIEGSIRGQWLGQATPATKLLLQHGFQELDQNQPKTALEDFDAALDLQPTLQEGWHGRAMARSGLGDYTGAERDLAETLNREPRQFKALEDLSHIAEERGNWRGAYEAWQRALEIDPMTPGGADRLKDLQRRAFGDAT